MDLLRIPGYPDSMDITLDIRPVLDPPFRGLKPKVSEFTFANIYLFRKVHNYRVSVLGETVIISGRDREEPFFMLPFGIPEDRFLRKLFEEFSYMKCVPEETAGGLVSRGYHAVEDRDNFDYIYLLSELSSLSGRKFHGRKNLVNFFISHYRHEARPLLKENTEDALKALEDWRGEQEAQGDYEAAKEALTLCDELKLCGGVYYVEGRPAAYSIGEELDPETFVLHFEKGLKEYKGLVQFTNQDFSERLAKTYRFLNMEQDLGDAGLRKFKMSYRPVDLIKKYRVSLDRGAV